MYWLYSYSYRCILLQNNVRSVRPTAVSSCTAYTKSLLNNDTAAPTGSKYHSSNPVLRKYVPSVNIAHLLDVLERQIGVRVCTRTLLLDTKTRVNGHAIMYHLPPRPNKPQLWTISSHASLAYPWRSHVSKTMSSTR